MKCTHTQQIIEKMSELIEKVNNSNSDLYIKIPCYSSNSDSSSGCNRVPRFTYTHTNTDIRKDAFGKYLSEIVEIISNCYCRDEVIDKYDDLIRDMVSKEDFNRIKNAYDELYESNKKDIKDYNELLRKNEVLVERCKSLTDRLGEYEEYKDEYDKIMRERVGEARTKTRLEEKVESLGSQLIDAKKQLKDVGSERDKLLIKLDEKNVIHNRKLEVLNSQLTTLQLESGKKDSELERKDEEIERLKNQAKSSDKRAEKTQEELLTEKLRSEKKSLELFANQELKIDMEQIHSLTKYHERLFIARKTHNQSNIDVHEGNISRTKKELQEKSKISVINIQEICQKCERIAEFSWELSQTQQQYQAQQGVPTNNF